MRRFIAFLIVVIPLGLGIAACNDSDDAPAEDASLPMGTFATSDYAEPSSVSLDENYLRMLDSEDVYYSSDAAAIAVADAVCEGMRGGDVTAPMLGFSIMDNGNYTAAEAGTILGAAMGTYCPQYQDTASAQFSAYN